MGLFYPTLLIPDLYPPPPRSWLVILVQVITFSVKVVLNYFP